MNYLLLGEKECKQFCTKKKEIKSSSCFGLKFLNEYEVRSFNFFESDRGKIINSEKKRTLKI